MRGEKGAALSRGQIDKLTDLVKKNGAKGLVWLKVKDGKLESPTAKFFTEEEMKALQAAVSAQEGDIIFVGSDANVRTCQGFMGALRKELVKNLTPKCEWAFAWITDFCVDYRFPAVGIYPRRGPLGCGAQPVHGPA